MTKAEEKAGEREPAKTAKQSAAKLFELSKEEAAQVERNYAAHRERVLAEPKARAAAAKALEAKFAALLKKHPIADDAPRVWSHKDLGEAAYIEVAINGGYFDPRTMAADYRPDLDIPNFETPDDAVYAKA